MIKRKHSNKRDAILETLKSTSTHPSAQWVYSKLKPVIPDLSMGTVYRNIKFFVKEGLAAFVGVVNGEERFDAIVTPHPHFICGHCGKVIDFNFFDEEKQMKNLTNNDSSVIFTIDYRKTIFKGICKDCSTIEGKEGRED
jgi:Fur family peroxide stress response transcriptional regulator